MESQSTLLSLQDVNLGYGALQVIFDVSMHVSTGELVGLVGGNGSGKSTILRAISGMVRPRSGVIRFCDEEIGDQKPHEMAARGLAHVPMGRQLFPELTVRENLRLGAFRIRDKAEIATRLEEVYRIFPDLREDAGMSAGALSGGQQQMVAVGRALMMRPRMLAMDEPSLGLSPLYVKQMMRSIRSVADGGLAVLIVEQNVKRVLEICDRAYVLENGHMVLEGSASELQGSELIRKAYLGL